MNSENTGDELGPEKPNTCLGLGELLRGLPLSGATPHAAQQSGTYGNVDSS